MKLCCYVNFILRWPNSTNQRWPKDTDNVRHCALSTSLQASRCGFHRFGSITMNSCNGIIFRVGICARNDKYKEYGFGLTLSCWTSLGVSRFWSQNVRIGTDRINYSVTAANEHLAIQKMCIIVNKDSAAYLSLYNITISRPRVRKCLNLRNIFKLLGGDALLRLCKHKFIPGRWRLKLRDKWLNERPFPSPRIRYNITNTSLLILP